MFNDDAMCLIGPSRQQHKHREPLMNIHTQHPEREAGLAAEARGPGPGLPVPEEMFSTAKLRARRGGTQRMMGHEVLGLMTQTAFLILSA